MRAPVQPAEASIRQDLDRLEAEARNQPGVADYLDVFDRYDAVMEQVRVYFEVTSPEPTYSTTDQSANGELG
jgi:hypothetical protein